MAFILFVSTSLLSVNDSVVNKAMINAPIKKPAKIAAMYGAIIAKNGCKAVIIACPAAFKPSCIAFFAAVVALFVASLPLL